METQCHGHGPNELFETYKVPDNIYFTITTIQTNQEDLLEMDVYLFDVYVEGKFETHGSVTSRIGYRSPNDCYDAALVFIIENWNTIEEYYGIKLTQSQPSLPQFHFGESSAKIGEYYYSVDESGLWDVNNILIKHKHSKELEEQLNTEN